jgi:hypothetical protein
MKAQHRARRATYSACSIPSLMSRGQDEPKTPRGGCRRCGRSPPVDQVLMFYSISAL